MKVNFNAMQYEIYAFRLAVGSTFITKDDIGVYMKIDKNNKCFYERYRENVMAVNLATGQVKAFGGDEKVQPVEAEVNVLE